MNRHSTLVSYLERLVWMLTGNFAKPGTQYSPSSLVPLARTSAVGPSTTGGGRAGHPGHRVADHLGADAVQRDPGRDPHRPPRPLPSAHRRERQPRPLARRLEADARGDRGARARGGHRCGDDRDGPPRRLRAAGDHAVREVRGDVLQLRVPAQRLPPPPPGARRRPRDRCPKPEIHARLVEASGAVDRRAARAAAGGGGREPSGVRRARSWRRPPPTPRSARWPRSCCTARSVRRCPTARRLPRSCGAPPRSARWRTRTACAAPGSATVPRPGDRLFDAILSSPSGVVFTIDEYEESWKRVGTADGRIDLAIPELLGELAAMVGEVPPGDDPEWPLHAVGRRAALVHRQHDHPRPAVAEEGRGRSAPRQPPRRGAPRPRRRRDRSDHDEAGRGSRRRGGRRRDASPGTCRCRTASDSITSTTATRRTRRHRQSHRTSSRRARTATPGPARRGTRPCRHAWRRSGAVRSRTATLTVCRCDADVHRHRQPDRRRWGGACRAAPGRRRARRIGRVRDHRVQPEHGPRPRARDRRGDARATS